MVYVGLVTGASTPSARAAPRTNVVLPAPSSPDTVTTSPGASSRARAAAIASVSSGEVEVSSTMVSSLELVSGRRSSLGCDGWMRGKDAGSAHIEIRYGGDRGRSIAPPSAAPRLRRRSEASSLKEAELLRLCGWSCRRRLRRELDDSRRLRTDVEE